MGTQPQSAGAAVIRPLAAWDHAALLRLNAEARPAVYPLDEATLAWLLGFDGHHLVAVDEQDRVLGYLLSFPRESAYDDTEIRWLRRRLAEPFHYICQVVIGREHRRRQIGRALYQTLVATARQRGAQALCCDVITDPPNAGSLAFHQGLGFGPLGRGQGSGGAAIMFLAKRLAVVGGPAIRPLAAADRAALLRLNAANRPAVAALDEADLTRLLEFGGHHLVAVDEREEVLGYLLSFPRDCAYDDSEINRLRRLVPGPFFYICQVVIAHGHRRRQIGRRLYHALGEAVRERGVRTLCTDVNIDPPNPESFGFHYDQGFARIGEGISSEGPAVAFLAKKL